MFSPRLESKDGESNVITTKMLGGSGFTESDSYLAEFNNLYPNSLDQKMLYKRFDNFNRMAESISFPGKVAIIVMKNKIRLLPYSPDTVEKIIKEYVRAFDVLQRADRKYKLIKEWQERLISVAESKNENSAIEKTIGIIKKYFDGLYSTFVENVVGVWLTGRSGFLNKTPIYYELRQVLAPELLQCLRNKNPDKEYKAWLEQLLLNVLLVSSPKEMTSTEHLLAKVPKNTTITEFVLDKIADRCSGKLLKKMCGMNGKQLKNFCALQKTIRLQLDKLDLVPEFKEFVEDFRLKHYAYIHCLPTEETVEQYQEECEYIAEFLTKYIGLYEFVKKASQFAEQFKLPDDLAPVFQQTTKYINDEIKKLMLALIIMRKKFLPALPLSSDEIQDIDRKASQCLKDLDKTIKDNIWKKLVKDFFEQYIYHRVPGVKLFKHAEMSRYGLWLAERIVSVMDDRGLSNLQARMAAIKLRDTVTNRALILILDDAEKFKDEIKQINDLNNSKTLTAPQRDNHKKLFSRLEIESKQNVANM